LLSAMYSPEIDEECSQLSRLVGDIHEVSQERNLLDVLEAMGSSPFVTNRIVKTDALRRFVNSRS
jgi:hypothetical protein